MTKDLVYEYFRFIGDKDLDALLNLFTDDAVIYEPFSKSDDGLRGRAAIEPFLKIAMMASDNLQRSIAIEKQEKDQISAIATFEKGDKVKGRFTFEFDSSNDKEPESKIKVLRIQFL